MTAEVLCVLNHPNPVEANAGRICLRHQSAIREQLTSILELYALLPLYLLPGSAPDTGKIKYTKNPEAPAPLRLDIAALSDARNGDVVAGGDIPAIPAQLAAWAAYVRQERRLDDPEKAADGLETVSVSVRMLHRHLGWLSEDDLVEAFADEVKIMHRALTTATGELPPKPITQCYIDVDGVECGGPIWLARDGEGARCGRCKTGWSGIDLVRLRLIIEQAS